MEQEEQEKAFVYRWHIEETKKYYLGSSKGIKPYYTHSSNDKEFCSYVPNSKSSVAEKREFLANMPEGITREIIAYGTYKNMLTLERTLQLHAKEHCWEEYYNDNVCDGIYHGFGSGEDHYMSGMPPENNPRYKDGVWVGASKDPKINAQGCKEWRDNRTPEKKEEDNRKAKEWRDNNKKETGYTQGYSQSNKKASMTPEEYEDYLRKGRVSGAKARAKKKAEKEKERGGEGTLEAFFG